MTKICESQTTRSSTDRLAASTCAPRSVRVRRAEEGGLAVSASASASAAAVAASARDLEEDDGVSG